MLDEGGVVGGLATEEGVEEGVVHKPMLVEVAFGD